MSDPPRSSSIRRLAAVVACASGIAVASQAAGQTPVTEGYRDFAYGSGVTGRPTGEKPESKLWWNDGSWWGSLYSPQAGRYRIHRFDRGAQRWIDTGPALDDRGKSKADVLWDAPSGHLYVASHYYSSSAAPTGTSARARLYRFTYDVANRRYTADPGFPVVISGGRSEALTIAKDSRDRLWITYVESGRVKINHSLSHDAEWATPANLPVSDTAATVSSDDISAIIAFGGDRVGVLWSNQLTQKMYFSSRRDADPVDQWSSVEQVLPGGVCSTSCADDHINLKADSLGRVFAALKTSASSSSQPQVVLAVRQSGGWDSYTVNRRQERHTRPIVLLDESHDLVFVIDTDESGGSAYLKVSPISEIAFEPGDGQVFIRSASDPHIDDVTSTKQNLTSQTGLLVLASDEQTRFYLHNDLPLDGSTPSVPAAPEDLDASAVTDSRIDLSWTDASNSENGFHVERAAASGSFSEIATVAADATGYSDTEVAAGTTYRYRVRARNSIGFSSYSNTAEATTPGSPPDARIKDITFEDGSLVHASTGADRAAGLITLDPGGVLVGTYSAHVPNAGSSYLEENFESTADLHVSLYLRVNALPEANSRIVLLMNGSTAIGNLLLRPSGRLRLRVGTTAIGAESAPLTVDQVYRVGIRQKSGSGGNAVLEAFLGTAGGEFQTPFAATSSGAWTAPATRLRVGPTGANAADVHVDDIRLDAASMPPPSD